MIGCKGIPAATSRGGGIETHVEELSTRLVARGHEVLVYVRPYANPEKRTEWKGVKLITLPTIDRKNFDAIVSALLASWDVLFQPVDIVHYHGVGPSTLAWIPRLFKPHTKVVVTFHSRDRFHGKWSWVARGYLALGEWTAVRFPNATIATSHVIKVFCKRMYGTDVRYIPNGVEIPALHPGADTLAKLDLEPGDYFFTLSRLVPHKAVEDVIEAFKRVNTTKKLVIIGQATYDDVTYENRLRENAADDPRIIFVGQQEGVALKQLIANGYAMVHASRSEGLSIAILEAMSYAKLVVMSDIPENLELIDHSGVSFKVGDVASLRDELQWVVGDPELVEERGKRAREAMRRLFSWNSVVDRTESLYQSLFRRGRA
ncbi:MAG: glycosyltransferase family 4 protein [Patescibacteria group bacterium]